MRNFDGSKDIHVELLKLCPKALNAFSASRRDETSDSLVQKYPFFAQLAISAFLWLRTALDGNDVG